MKLKESIARWYFGKKQVENGLTVSVDSYHNELNFNIGCSFTYEEMHNYYRRLIESHGYIPKNDNRGVHIERVIWNYPATIVFWSDGTKTVVKAHGEVFDEEKGLAMAIAKKALGNKGNYYNVFKRFLITDEDLESIGEEPKSVADIIVEMCGNLEKNVQKRLEGMKDD